LDTPFTRLRVVPFNPICATHFSLSYIRPDIAMPLPPSLQRCIYRHPPSSHVRLPHGLTHRFEGEKRRGGIFIQDVLEDCINSLFCLHFDRTFHRGDESEYGVFQNVLGLRLVRFTTTSILSSFMASLVWRNRPCQETPQFVVLIG
jgi:hypothetical protein